MSTAAFGCPVDEDCGYSADSRGSVRAHITASGGAHEGLSGPDFSDDEIPVVGEQDSQQSPEQSTAEQSSDDSTAGNPVMGDADPGSSQNEQVDLPCGHESFSRSDAPEPPFGVSCSECGESWAVSDL